jgi:hypothetical protein
MEIGAKVLGKLGINKALFKHDFFHTEQDFSDDVWTKLVEAGNWSLIPILKHRSVDHFYCLRMIPWESPKDWSVVDLDLKLNSRVTVGKNLGNFLSSFFYFFGGIRKSSHYQMDLKASINELKEFFERAPASLRNSSAVNELFKIIAANSVSDLFDGHPADMDFLMASDDSKKSKSVRNEISQAQKNQNYIPHLIDEDYGYLNSLVSNAVMIQSVKSAYEKNWDLSINAIWRAFTEITFFDTQSYDILQIPQFSGDCRDSVHQAASLFLSEDDEEYIIPESKKTEPMYEVITAVAEAGFDQYSGAEHLILASYLDMQKNDAQNSWNAIINCGYWCAENTGVTSGGALEAAVYLSKKHSWVDANSVLTEYLELYSKNLG